MFLQHPDLHHLKEPRNHGPNRPDGPRFHHSLSTRKANKLSNQHKTHQDTLTQSHTYRRTSFKRSSDHRDPSKLLNNSTPMPGPRLDHLTLPQLPHTNRQSVRCLSKGSVSFSKICKISLFATASEVAFQLRRPNRHSERGRERMRKKLTDLLA